MTFASVDGSLRSQWCLEQGSTTTAPSHMSIDEEYCNRIERTRTHHVSLTIESLIKMFFIPNRFTESSVVLLYSILDVSITFTKTVTRPALSSSFTTEIFVMQQILLPLLQMFAQQKFTILELCLM